MKRSLLGTGVLTIALLSGSAFADHGRGHDRDHDGWRHHEHAQRVADHRPAGWDHGQKRGWGDHNVPPGQAKHQAWERHEAREHREHEWRAREAREHRAHELREHHEAQQAKMNDWRERERREHERRAEWARKHPHSGPWAHPTAPTGSTTPGTVATTRTPTNTSPVILPSGRRLPPRPTTNQ